MAQRAAHVPAGSLAIDAQAQRPACQVAVGSRACPRLQGSDQAWGPPSSLDQNQLEIGKERVDVRGQSRRRRSIVNELGVDTRNSPTGETDPEQPLLIFIAAQAGIETADVIEHLPPGDDCRAGRAGGSRRGSPQARDLRVWAWRHPLFAHPHQ